MKRPTGNHSQYNVWCVPGKKEIPPTFEEVHVEELRAILCHPQMIRGIKFDHREEPREGRLSWSFPAVPATSLILKKADWTVAPESSFISCPAITSLFAELFHEIINMPTTSNK